MKIKLFFFLTIVFLGLHFLLRNTLSADTTDILFPKERLLEPLLFDPYEALSYITISNSSNYPLANYIFMPIAIGTMHPLYQWSKQQPSELALEAAAYIQLEVTNIYKDSICCQEWRRNLINTDYQLSLSYSKIINNKYSFRFKLMHLSSHLGDDYIYTHHLTQLTTNPVNYNSLFFSYFIQLQQLRLNAGFDYVGDPETIRKRLSFEFGCEYKYKLNKHLSLQSGIHLRLRAQNNFTPNIKCGTGISLTGKPYSPSLLFEFYSGHYPYSQLEYKKIKWIGIGLYFKPY